MPTWAQADSDSVERAGLPKDREMSHVALHTCENPSSDNTYK